MQLALRDSHSAAQGRQGLTNGWSGANHLGVLHVLAPSGPAPKLTGAGLEDSYSVNV